MFRSILKFSAPTAERSKASSVVNLLYTVSPALQTIVGKSSATRGDVLKGFWEYVKTNSLQDKKKKSEIIADLKLETAVGKKVILMKEVMGIVSKHLTPPANYVKAASKTSQTPIHSPSLQAITGVPSASHAQTIKLVWDYIRKNNLARKPTKGAEGEPSTKYVMVDARLAAVFGDVKTLTQKEIMKNVSKHYIR